MALRTCTIAPVAGVGLANQVPALWLFTAVGRRRWRALVVIVILIGLTGGAALAAIAGARRSASSVARFERAGHEMDALVTASEGDDDRVRHVLDGPLVHDYTEQTFVFLGGADPDTPEIFVFAPTQPTPSKIGQGVLQRGRRVNPKNPDEVVLFEKTALLLGVHVGDTFPAVTASPKQAEAILEGKPLEGMPAGPKIPLHVVGISRNAKDLSNQVGDGNFTFLSPAFLTRYGGKVGVGTGSFAVDLVDGADGVPALRDAMAKEFAGSVVPGIEAGAQNQALDDSIAVITRALLIFALVVLLAGLAGISTTIGREQRRAAEDVAVMRRLGMTNREARVLLAGSFVPALVAGTALAVTIAVLISPRLPVGLARRVDPDLGVHFDAAVLLAGALILLAVVAGMTWLAASRAVATSGRPTRAPHASTRFDRAVAWMTPAPRSGVRFAFTAPRDGGGRGRAAVIGAVLAVVGLVAVSIVASSTNRLLASPPRWGVNWDVAVAAEALDAKTVLKNPNVGAAANGNFDDRVEVDHHGALSMVLSPIKGEVQPTLIAGREAQADNEVAIGRDTQHATGAAIGDTVEVRSATEHSTFRVVGIAVFPSPTGQALPLADGAQFSAAGGARLKIGDPSRNDAGTRVVLIRWKAGVDAAAARAKLGLDKSLSIVPAPPPEVDRLDEVSGFPAALAITLVVLGTIAVSYTLGATVARRRRELGILSVLGFRPRQRRTVIATQATSLAIAALALGIPIGLVVGRFVWLSIARAIGVATDPSVPSAEIAIGAALLVIAFNVIAAVPAWAAGRMRVVESLRAE